MKLNLLVDDSIRSQHMGYAEHGFSALLTLENKKILFDVGYSDVLLKNAHHSNIDLFDLDYLVLSHRHFDHTWGLSNLLSYYNFRFASKNKQKLKPILMAGDDVFKPTQHRVIPEVGSFVSKETLAKYFDLHLSSNPVWITENLVYLGTIPKQFDFDHGDKYKDITEDTALAYVSDKGLVIVSACSHAGICNIVEYAKTVCNIKKVYAVIGGFHLIDFPKLKLEQIAGYMKSQQIQCVYPCHCTDLQAKLTLAKTLPVYEAGVGLTLEF